MMEPERSSRIWAMGISLSLVILVTCIGVYWIVWKGPRDLAEAAKDGVIEVAESGYDLFRRAGKDIYKALQFEPKVVIGSKTVHGPATQEAEVVTATKTFQHTYMYESTWSGSTKRLEIRGDFTAKAGFPLGDSFLIRISEDGRTVTLRHRKPGLISCEMTKLEVLQDESGWWNRIQPEERESALNELMRQARDAARESDLLKVAGENLHERLAPLSHRYSFETRSEEIP